MSVENLKKFGKMCAEDKAIQIRAKEIGLNDIEGLIAYAQELNLDFTMDDMLELSKESGLSQDELNEEDLEKIAGGIATGTLIGAAGAAVIVAVVGTTMGAAGTIGLATMIDAW